MRLYYTGAPAYQAPQTAGQSLGGYPSSSLVANDTLDAVFGAWSPYARQQPGATQVRCLALLNETTQPVTDLHVLLVEHPELTALLAGGQQLPAGLELEVGLSLPNLDADENPYFELVPEPGASPYYVTFAQSAQLQPALEPGQVVAIWLRLRNTSTLVPATTPTPLPTAEQLPQLLRLQWS